MDRFLPHGGLRQSPLIGAQPSGSIQQKPPFNCTGFEAYWAQKLSCQLSAGSQGLASHLFSSQKPGSQQCEVSQPLAVAAPPACQAPGQALPPEAIRT